MDLFIDASDAAMRRTERQVVTPFELANIDTGLYQPVKAMAEPRAILLVAGETLADFCLYYSLSKLRQPVIWLPLKFLISQSDTSGKRVLLDHYADFYSDALLDSDADRGILSTSWCQSQQTRPH